MSNPPLPAGKLSTALTSSRIPGLDFLRALAVMLVLADHSGIPAVGPVLLTNGGLGVEIFFVLSGFLITWILLAEYRTFGQIRLKDFYQRRAARLLPAFYLYVAAGLAILWVARKPIPWDAVIAASLYVVNYYQAFTGASSHFLSHCWSLAVEEQFYFLWPCLLILLLKRKLGLKTAIAALIGLIWAYRAAATLWFGASDEYLYRALETRSDHLLMGSLLAALLQEAAWQQRFEAMFRRWWVAPTLVVLLIASTSSHGHLPYKYALGFALEPVLIAALLPLLVLQAQKASGWRRILTASLVATIGQASYGIYLFHPFLVHPVRNAVERLTGSFPLAFLVSILGVTIVAVLSYRLIESPLRQRWQPKHRASPIQKTPTW